MIVGAKFWLIVASIGLFLGAALHVAALLGGPKWIAFVGAPPIIVESAKTGTWLAPVGTLAITALLLYLAYVAFSLTGYMQALPLSRAVLWATGVLFVLRGLIILPMLSRMNWRAIQDLFVVGSSTAIFIIGISCILGLSLKN